MVEKRRVIPRGIHERLIGISGNSAVPLKPPVKNPLILIGLYHLLHPVRGAGIRQNQFKIPIGLAQHGIHHLSQIGFLCLIERHKNAEPAGKSFAPLPLLIQLLLRRLYIGIMLPLFLLHSLPRRIIRLPDPVFFQIPYRLFEITDPEYSAHPTPLPLPSQNSFACPQFPCAPL